jgi:hypothetical protein
MKRTLLRSKKHAFVRVLARAASTNRGPFEGDSRGDNKRGGTGIFF